MQLINTLEIAAVGGAISQPFPFPLPFPLPIPCPLPWPMPMPFPMPIPFPGLPSPDLLLY